VLSETERRLGEAFLAGAQLDLRTGNQADDDPAGSGSWQEDRHVRAEVLAALLCNPAPARASPTAGVRLRGALLIGRLEIPEATLSYSLQLEGCCIDDGIGRQCCIGRLVRVTGRDCAGGRLVRWLP
jgi:hypothetical protein